MYTIDCSFQNVLYSTMYADKISLQYMLTFKRYLKSPRNFLITPRTCIRKITDQPILTPGLLFEQTK
jgi:hypothetical protein